MRIDALTSWQLSDLNSTRYRTAEKLGEGSFGRVYAAIDSLTNIRVAVKQVRIQQGGRDASCAIPKALFREIEALRQLSASDGYGMHIVKLLDLYPMESDFCIVLEYVDSNLGELLMQAETYLSVDIIKRIALMLLRALWHCHSHSIVHRDVKPSNVLIDRSGVAKLSDFGLARVCTPNEDLSHQVSTRWYRAPELLFASRHYDFSVDIWSAGAVIAEMWTLSPFFPGANDIDQIFRVFQVMGTPSKQSWPVPS